MADEVPNGGKQEHEWFAIRLGRMCWRCNLVQANGEFDDSEECHPRPETQRLESQQRLSRRGG